MSKYYESMLKSAAGKLGTEITNCDGEIRKSVRHIRDLMWDLEMEDERDIDALETYEDEEDYNRYYNERLGFINNEVRKIRQAEKRTE